MRLAAFRRARRGLRRAPTNWESDHGKVAQVCCRVGRCRCDAVPCSAGRSRPDHVYDFRHRLRARLDATAFTDAVVTVTATGDTDSRVSGVGTALSIQWLLETSSVPSPSSVAGFGSGHFGRRWLCIFRSGRRPPIRVWASPSFRRGSPTIMATVAAGSSSITTWPPRSVRSSAPASFESDAFFDDDSVDDFNLTSIGNTTFEATIASEVPLPAALPLFASGLGALGLLGWRRRSKRTTGTAA